MCVLEQEMADNEMVKHTTCFKSPLPKVGPPPNKKRLLRFSHKPLNLTYI